MSPRCQQSFANRAVAASTAVCCLAILCIPLLTSPVHAFSKQTREAGAETFRSKGCEHCHGVDGIGTDRGPDLSTVGKRWKGDRIEKQIREGGGGMPPFGDALQPDEMKHLVDYLSAKRKSLNREDKTPVQTKPASPDDSGL